jgi:hypothetical protein
MAQGRRKKRSSGSIGGSPGRRSVDEMRPRTTTAGASPAELRGGVGKRRGPPPRTIDSIAGANDPQRFSERYDEKREKQRKSDLKRIREIRRRQRAQAQIDKAKQGKTGRGVASRAASVGMGPARITGGGGLDLMLSQQDLRTPRKMNMGGVMRARGGTFKGVF